MIADRTFALPRASSTNTTDPVIDPDMAPAMQASYVSICMLLVFKTLEELMLRPKALRTPAKPGVVDFAAAGRHPTTCITDRSAGGSAYLHSHLSG